MIKIGDLVVGRIRACLGIVVKESENDDYVWVCWATGTLRNKRSCESREMLYIFNGGKDGKHILEW